MSLSKWLQNSSVVFCLKIKFYALCFRNICPFGCKAFLYLSFYVSYIFTGMCYQLYGMVEFIEADILISLHVNLMYNDIKCYTVKLWF